MKVQDYLTHIDNEEDKPFLRTKLLDVNMRLFNSSTEYSDIVRACARYVVDLAGTTMDGYKKPHGMSGANLGIPFNIIAYVKNRNEEDEEVVLMINPKILHATATKQIVMSNCGSIRLEEPIPVERAAGVLVSWYNYFGKKQQGVFRRGDGGFTIQHEIDHNLGVLITDRAV